ncbi:MAG TPA: hypothetical protein VKQ73_00045 [Stellaceae bacterium]|nr:hypothetical protein [Stellaceae bacterium]
MPQNAGRLCQLAGHFAFRDNHVIGRQSKAAERNWPWMNGDIPQAETGIFIEAKASGLDHHTQE